MGGSRAYPYLVLFRLFFVDDSATAFCRLSTADMIAAGLGFALSE